MKTALAILAPGFEEIEAITIIDLLRRAEINVTTTSITDPKVEGAHNITILADTLFQDSININYDLIILPGGQPGTTNLKKSDAVIDLLKRQNSKNKLIAAICAAPTVLADAGLVNGKNITSYPSEKGVFDSSNYKEDNVVQDGNIITSRAVGTAIDLSLFLIKKLCGEMKANEITEKILYRSAQ